MSVRVIDLASDFLVAVLGAHDRREGWTGYEQAHTDVFEIYFQNPFWGKRSNLDVNGHLKVPTFGQLKVPTRRSLLLALTSS